MCLGIPMQIVSVDGRMAKCAARGEMREVSLLLLEDESVAVDDYVVVHLGHALRRIPEQEALSIWALLDEILAAGSQA